MNYGLVSTSMEGTDFNKVQDFGDPCEQKYKVEKRTLAGKQCDL